MVGSSDARRRGRSTCLPPTLAPSRLFRVGRSLRGRDACRPPHPVRRCRMPADGLSTSDLTALLDAISDGVVAQTTGNRYVYVNAVAARLLGFAHPTELLRTKPS